MSVKFHYTYLFLYIVTSNFIINKEEYRRGRGWIMCSNFFCSQPLTSYLPIVIEL